MKMTYNIIFITLLLTTSISAQDFDFLNKMRENTSKAINNLDKNSKDENDLEYEESEEIEFENIDNEYNEEEARKNRKEIMGDIIKKAEENVRTKEENEIYAKQVTEELLVDIKTKMNKNKKNKSFDLKKTEYLIRLKSFFTCIKNNNDSKLYICNKNMLSYLSSEKEIDILDY